MSFAAGAAVLAATLRWRLPLARAMTISAAALAALELMNGRQAFCNYYWLVGALLCTATVLHTRSTVAEAQAALVLSDNSGSSTAQLDVREGSL
jgi:hypothetical protein